MWYLVMVVVLVLVLVVLVLVQCTSAGDFAPPPPLLSHIHVNTTPFSVQFDVAWKNQLRVVYPTPQAYQSVLANVSIATGLLTMALMLTGKFVFQFFGWTTAAIATPLVMFASGAAFFGLSLAAQFGWTVPGVATADLALLGVTAGIITQVFARSSKFSLFDPAKEMVRGHGRWKEGVRTWAHGCWCGEPRRVMVDDAPIVHAPHTHTLRTIMVQVYIEMDKEEKSKGKAAVDLLGSQVGKSGASWLTQALLLGMGSIAAAQPVLAVVYMVVIALWLRAVGQLAGEIDEQERAAAARKEAASRASDASFDELRLPGEVATEEVGTGGGADVAAQGVPVVVTPSA